MVNSAARYASDVDPREQGFLKSESAGPICAGSSNTVRAGYFVKPRPPEKGETESAYRRYLEHERKRVHACAVAGLYCTTTAILLPQDSFARGHGNCRVNFESVHKPRRAYESSEAGGLLCAHGRPEYVSPLHSQTYTSHGWVTNFERWRQFCEQHQTADKCAEILKPARTDDLPFQNPYPEWAVRTLQSSEPEVYEEGGTMWSTVETDLTPACPLVEKRN